MIKATSQDKSLVVRLLAESFQENKSVNYIVRQDDGKFNRIRALMDYSFEMCFQFGEVWLSEDDKACALILFPHQKRTSIRSIWLDIKLVFSAIGLSGLSKALDREGKIKAKQPKIDMAYLWFIGVDPVFHHEGIGSKLIKEIISESDAKQLPVYLETSTVKNLPWYKALGFQIYNQLELNYTLFFLKRGPE